MKKPLRRKNLQDTVKLMSALNPNLAQTQIIEIMRILENSKSVDTAITEVTRSGIAITQNQRNQNQFRVEQKIGYGDYLIVNESHLAEYLKQGYEWVRELGTEKRKETVSDEIWKMPNGETISRGEKIYAEINQNGTIEIRGSPSTLNEIEDELAQLGVRLEKIEQGKRYLLKKKV